MSKSDNFYFENYIACATISLRTAQSIHDLLIDFKASETEENIKRIHDIEHQGDQKRHELIERVTKDFITPLERDDMIKLSNGIDDITDRIEDVLIHIYISGEKSIRPDVVKFSDLLIQICTQTLEMIKELPDFRKSKTLSGLISSIHRTEEEGDRLYMNAMRTLYATETSPIKVLAWRQIYETFENCFDACAEVAETAESVVISNI